MAQIYRKTALDKMSSPEQLDKTLKITSPLSWLALIAVTVIVVVAVVWGCGGFNSRIMETITAQGVLVEPDGVCSVFATEGGKVIEIMVEPGEEIRAGDPILIYTTDSDEDKTLYSDQDGTVHSVLKKTEDKIQNGEEVIRVTPAVANREMVAVCYVTAKDAEKIRDKVDKIRGTTENVEAQVIVDKVNDQKYGHMVGRVFAIDSSDTTNGDNGARWVEILGAGKADEFSQGKAKTAIVCEFYFRDQDAQTGQKWSNEKGYTQTVRPGNEVTVRIVTDKVVPIVKLFEKLDEIWNGKKEK